MNNYDRGNRSGGGGYRRGFQGRDSVRREMYKAVCDECGKECEVPFKPSGNKPVYCSKCFEKRNGGNSRRSSRKRFGESSFGKRDNTNKQLLEQVSSLNVKLDRILKVIEMNTIKETVAKKTAVKKFVSKDKKIEKKKVSKKRIKKSKSKD